MKNILQLIGAWLAEKFNKIEATFSTKDELSKHNTSPDSHKDIRGKINDIVNGNTIVGRSESASIIGTKEDGYTKPQLENLLNTVIVDVLMDPSTFILTFNYRNGTQKTFDLPIEMTVKDGRYDEETKELVLVLVSDQEIRIPAAGLIKVYIGKESTTTTVSINERTGEISVDVKQGSITKDHLDTELQTELNKLTDLPDNANETFATKEELAKSGARVVPVNFINTTYAERNTQVLEALSDITTVDKLQEKPLYLLATYLSDVYEKRVLIPLILSTKDNARAVSYLYSANIDDTQIMTKYGEEDEIDVWFLGGIKIAISFSASKTNTLTITGVTYGEDDITPDQTNHGAINVTFQLVKSLSVNTPYTSMKYTKSQLNYARSKYCLDLKGFLDALTLNKTVAGVNFMTETSEFLYPAYVDYSIVSSKFSDVNYIKFVYLKEIDGVEKIVTELLDFRPNGGLKAVVNNLKNFTYIKHIEDVYTSPCLIHVDAGGETGTYTVNTEEVEAYYQKAMAGMDKNNVRIVWSNVPNFPVVAIVQENVIILTYNIPSIQEANNAILSTIMQINCVKINDTWTCDVLNKSITIAPEDYIKIQNIHVVSEHPTDLTAYPDGSIFIKTA